jgi:hypothetical protein
MDHALGARRAAPLRDFVVGGDVGHFSVRQVMEFAADGIGGEASAKEGTVERSDFLVVDFTPLFAAGEQFELALQARTNGGAFGLRIGSVGDGGVDVVVGNAAGAQIAGDAEFAVPADFRALAHKLFGVPRIVKLAVFFKARHHDLDQEFIVSSPRQHLLHFMHGVSPPHQRADGNFVEFLFGCELARFAEHQRSMKQGTSEVKK